MISRYLKTIWLNKSTRMSPENFNKMENGIESVTDGLIAVDGLKADLTYVDNKDNEVKKTIGPLGNLTTTDKTSIVQSINEINTKINTLEIDGGTF